MQIILVRCLILLGALTYCSVALVWQQTSRLPLTVGFQNDLGFNIDTQPTIPSTTISDFKAFRPTSVLALPTDLATPNLQTPTPAGKPLPAIAIDRREEDEPNVHSRRLLPGAHDGFNVDTILSAAGITNTHGEAFQPLRSTPSITQRKTYTDVFTDIFPTTTHTITTTIMGPPIYVREAAVTVAPRDVKDSLDGESDTSTVTIQESWETPRTFQTITGAPSPTSSTITQGNERRGYYREVAACEALVSSEVFDCLVEKSLLIPVRTQTVVASGSTHIVIEVSEPPHRRADGFVPLSTAVITPDAEYSGGF